MLPQKNQQSLIQTGEPSSDVNEDSVPQSGRAIQRKGSAMDASAVDVVPTVTNVDDQIPTTSEPVNPSRGRSPYCLRSRRQYSGSSSPIPLIRRRASDDLVVEDFEQIQAASRAREGDDAFRSNLETPARDEIPQYIDTIQQDLPSNPNRFRSTGETPPRDTPMFEIEAALNESAEEYVRHRDYIRMRRDQLDLYLGVLSIANVDDVISVSDITDYVTCELADRGVQNLVATGGPNSIEVEYTISVNDEASDDIPQSDEIPHIDEKQEKSDEIPRCDDIPLKKGVSQRKFSVPLDDFGECASVLNGHALPDIIPRSFSIELKKAERNSCALCDHSDLEYQFSQRYSKESLKHLMNHGRPVKSNVNSGKFYEDTFGLDLSLRASNYGREVNYLPTAADILEAITIISEDDNQKPSRPLTSLELITLAMSGVKYLDTGQLILYLAYIYSAEYVPRGSVIRSVTISE